VVRVDYFLPHRFALHMYLVQNQTEWTTHMLEMRTNLFDRTLREAPQVRTGSLFM